MLHNHCVYGGNVLRWSYKKLVHLDRFITFMLVLQLKIHFMIKLIATLVRLSPDIMSRSIIVT